MSMDPSIIARVEDRLFSARIRHEAEAAERRRDLYVKYPRLRELDAELGSTMAGILRANAASGEDYRPKLEELKRRNLERQAERAEILKRAGLSPSALEPDYDCRDCGDTGFLRDGTPCKCLLRGYRDEQLSELERRLPVRRATFGSFNEKLYSDEVDENWGVSPRENAVAVRDACRGFASRRSAGSIVLCGGAGVGKTFLASCVAVEASEHCFSVVCRQMTEVVSLYEREKFTRDDDTRDAARAEIDRLCGCDILIIDGVGSEFRAPFVVTVLLSLFASRMSPDRRTLICTSVDEREFESRYDAETASRLKGDFDVLPIFGRDLRIKE